MSCEKLKRQNLRLERWAAPRRLAIGLCGTALLLMGCRSGQVSGGEAIASNGTTMERQAESSAPADQATESAIQSSLTGIAQVLPVAAQVDLGGEVIDLEVTRTVQEQATGLMYRASLADERGMLFRFTPARPVQFWMKNVVIDLDMVFVHNDEIVGIAADVPPCTTTTCPTYGPGFGVLVDEVIELRGGRAAELGLEIGDPALVQPLEVDQANEQP